MAMLDGLLKKLRGEDEDPMAASNGGINGAGLQRPAGGLTLGSLQGPSAPMGGGDKLQILAEGGGQSPEAKARYDQQQNDFLRRTQALDPLTGGDAGRQIDRERQDSMRQFFGAGYHGDDPGFGGAASPAPGGQSGLAPAASKPLLGAFANKLEGFDSGKLNDASYNSPKYAIGRAISGFDPRQGVTDDVLKALNSSGAGQQYKRLSKDKVVGDDGRVVDLVRGINDPNGTGGWQLGLEDEPGAAPQQGGMNAGRPSFAGSTIAPLLHSDAQSNIQQALGKFSAAQDNGYLQQLLAALSGGQQ